MQVRPEENGPGHDVPDQRDQGRASEVIFGMLRVPCPLCRATPGQRCFQWNSAKQQVYWDETVHHARKRILVMEVANKLRGIK
jgi:hypothetical protein